MARVRVSSRRAVGGLLCVAFLLAACDGGEDAPTDDTEAAGDGTDAPDGAPADGPPLPDVATVEPEEVEEDADPDSLDGRIASAAADLPDGWAATVVADPILGPYVIGLPSDATVWRVGDDLQPLRDAVGDDAWLRYWDPVLAAADEVADSSSLWAAVVLWGGSDDELHLTITATPREDLPADDPEAVAASFADTFRDQRLTVVDVTTQPAGDREVAALTLETPEDEFDDGVPRRLLQWFHPEPDGPVFWSVTCGGPVPAAATVDERCPTALASFRTPPR